MTQRNSLASSFINWRIPQTDKLNELASPANEQRRFGNGAIFRATHHNLSQTCLYWKSRGREKREKERRREEERERKVSPPLDPAMTMTDVAILQWRWSRGISRAVASPFLRSTLCDLCPYMGDDFHIEKIEKTQFDIFNESWRRVLDFVFQGGDMNIVNSRRKENESRSKQMGPAEPRGLRHALHVPHVLLPLSPTLCSLICRRHANSA
ncbi:uncharacterized protein J5F26_004837 isoform 1-T1 [Ciconia maguari]